MAPRISDELRRWPANDGEVERRLSAVQVAHAVADGGRFWGTKQRRERECGVFLFGFLLVTIFPAIID